MAIYAGLSLAQKARFTASVAGFWRRRNMRAYRVLTFEEEAMLPQEVVDAHGRVIQAESRKEAEDTFAGEMWEMGIFREEYDSFLDFFAVPEIPVSQEIADLVGV